MEGRERRKPRCGLVDRANVVDMARENSALVHSGQGVGHAVYGATFNGHRGILSRVIRSFRCKETEKLFQRQQSRRFGNIGTVARRKLRMLDDAEKLEDMAAVPGNRLESLGGDRKGPYSIRINDQWRICFIWRSGAAESVEIVDYHERGEYESV